MLSASVNPFFKLFPRSFGRFHDDRIKLEPADFSPRRLVSHRFQSARDEKDMDLGPIVQEVFWKKSRIDECPWELRGFLA